MTEQRQKRLVSSVKEALNARKVVLHWPIRVSDRDVWKTFYAGEHGWTALSLQMFSLCLEVGGAIEIVN